MGDVSTQWVGLDVHKSSISVAILGPDGSVKVEKRTGTDERSVAGLIRELRALKRQGPVECVYEAGPTGYTLQRELTAGGSALHGGGAVVDSAQTRRSGRRRIGGMRASWRRTYVRDC